MQIIGRVAPVFPTAAVWVAIVLGSLGYMGWLRWQGLLIVVPLMVTETVVYLIGMRAFKPAAARERDSYDTIVHEQQQILTG